MKLITSAVFLVVGCQNPSVPVQPDADSAPTPSTVVTVVPDTYGCGAACANVTKIGCVLPNCPTVCVHVMSTPGFDNLNLPCLKAAKTVADVQACGTVKCGATP